MINITLPSLRPVKPIPLVSSNQEPVKSLFKEAQRRDNIIKKLASECLYKANDIVKPSRLENEKIYGSSIKVISIIDSYTQFGKKEPWPTSDQPMIVYAFSEKEKSYFFCTINYLKEL